MEKQRLSEQGFSSEDKIIEAKRDRNNKISFLMGQYLLKGYKMLATTCKECDCILMEDRQQKLFCIGCSEVDADNKKDNPAVSDVAAQRTAQEHSLLQKVAVYNDRLLSQSVSTLCDKPRDTERPTNDYWKLKIFEESQSILLQKLDAVNKKLDSCSRLQDHHEYVKLLNDIVCALTSVRKLEQLYM